MTVRLTVGFLGGLALALTGPIAGQQADDGPGQPTAIPADAFVDEGARPLVLRAVEASRELAEGLDSYEANLTERMRVGVAIGGRLLGRDRTLYHREEVSRIRWSDRALDYSRVC